MNRRTVRYTARRAFTLVEMLTASVLALFIAGLVLGAFRATATLWRRSEQRSDTAREARTAIDRMERDLAMVVPAFGGVAPLRLSHLPGTPPGERVYDALYALASLPDAGAGAISAIGYRCRWDAAARCYVLVRLFRDAEATLTALETAPETVFDDPSGAGEEPLARYVWDFEVRPCVKGEPASAFPNRAYPGALPAWVEIRFKVAGPLAVEKLASLPVTRETWENPDDPLFRRVIAPYQQTYVTRIRLPIGQ